MTSWAVSRWEESGPLKWTTPLHCGRWKMVFPHLGMWLNSNTYTKVALHFYHDLDQTRKVITKRLNIDEHTHTSDSQSPGVGISITRTNGASTNDRSRCASRWVSEITLCVHSGTCLQYFSGYSSENARPRDLKNSEGNLQFQHLKELFRLITFVLRKTASSTKRLIISTQSLYLNRISAFSTFRNSYKVS